MNTSIYQNIATRTAGDIYIGVVGPVRTGKSTFIKRFMETQVIPNIDNVYRKERARDELPQSGSGRTIMTAEPKFVPEEAAQIQLPDGASFSVRLIDCVGYMVKGAIGQMEDDTPRMVTTPWYDHEIPMTEAAEIGTRKVIAEHSTIGIVITTDGTISDIPREDYLEAEERVIRELQELGKPFIVLLNSADPRGDRAQAIAKDISSRYEVNCMAVNCLELDEDAVAAILKAVLYEFPMQELDLFLPPWVDALPADHPIKAGLYDAIRQNTAQLRHIREVEGVIAALGESEHISEARISAIDLGTGVAAARLALPRELFYKTLSEQSGFEVGDDGDSDEPADEAGGGEGGVRQGSRRPPRRPRDGLRHRGPRHRRAEAGGAGDHEAGRPVRRAAEGQRPQHPHDPGGHRDCRQPHRGQREAVRGHGELPAAGV